MTLARGLAPELLGAAFPFHLVLDRDGRIVQAGETLMRVCPALSVGARADDVFEVMAPRGVSLTSAGWAGHARSLWVLRSRECLLRLRGQVLCGGEDGYFVGSPWVTELDELPSLGIELSDFAVHDPAGDFLMLMQAQRAALADAERLAERLAAAAAERDRLAAAERTLGAELSPVPDISVRVDAGGRLLEIRESRQGDAEDASPLLDGPLEAMLVDGELRRGLDRALRARATQGVTFAHSDRDEERHYEARLSPLGDDEVLLVVRDVTDRRELERQLAYQAFHDALTGLANRTLFCDRVTHALADRATAERQVSLLLIDLDNFKLVNDTLGHAAGDELLCAVAERLRALTRPADTVARLGGDEFAILVIGPLDTGGALAERILEALGAPLTIEGLPLSIRASVGVATAGPVCDADLLLRHADTAMYAAKRAGKGAVRVYHNTMDLELRDRLRTESELRAALEHDEFVLAYQPIVELTTGREVGREALIRWQHPERGLLAPGEFIPVAEETGLIVALGRWVLHRACADAAAWPACESPLALSVNLSAHQLREASLLDDVRVALQHSGLDAARLCLEITETVLIADLDQAAERLGQLRNLGVRIALDDFGTGESTLARLRGLPIDTLKIDRSFINAVTASPRDAAVARALVDLGTGLGLSVVAEGIEADDQATALQELHCPYGQGYLFGRPALQTAPAGP